MSVYADTSFLASLYIPDANSAAAAQRMERMPLPVLITPLVELELANALRLRLFRKELRPIELRAAHAAFRADVQDGVLAMSPLPEAIYAQARLLVSKWTATLDTRTLDILHVAAALNLRADAFHTFDERQRKLAKAAGIRVV